MNLQRVLPLTGLLQILHPLSESLPTIHPNVNASQRSDVILANQILVSVRGYVTPVQTLMVSGIELFLASFDWHYYIKFI